MTSEKRTPKIELGAVIVTLHGREIFRNRDDAERLAEATGTQVAKYGEGKEERTIQIELKKPPMTIITVTRHGDGRPGNTEFIIYVNDLKGSLKRELEEAAGLIDQGTRLHPEGPAESGPPKETLFKAIHLMNTDEMPREHPREQRENPVAQRFLTPSGNRCLSTMTWRRDRELEQIDIENDEHQGPQYAFRIETMTTVPEEPGSQALMEIIMSAYTVGAKFLLGDPIEDGELQDE